jgi:anti-sigma regulatory factor (Ser/Thr protein kinase)
MAPDRCTPATRGARAVGGLDVTLDPDAHAPGRARTAIRGWSEHMPLEPLRRDALELLVSETVTNAVQHALAPEGAPINLVASSEQDEILVRVTDRGLGPQPRMRAPSRGLGGYGLHIVDRESRRWGVERMAGTTVWFAI